MPTLLLFDIDGTLLDSSGAGAGAILDAVESVLGFPRHELPPLELAGATDISLARTIFRQTGSAWDDEVLKRFFSVYLAQLHKRLAHPEGKPRILPGVIDLLDQIKAHTNASTALLTGNIRPGAFAKLQSVAIDHYFAEGAFGDDAEIRIDLGPIAVERCSRHFGKPFQAADVIVIGDTPRDIAVAHHIGAKCLAVATGQFSKQQLLEHEPWLVVENFQNTKTIWETLREIENL